MLDSREWNRGLLKSHLLFSRLTADIDRRLATKSATPTERRILIGLTLRPRVSDAFLFRDLGLDRSHFSRVINKLIKERSVTWEVNPEHRGQRLLSLTEGGKGRADALVRAWYVALGAQF